MTRCQKVPNVFHQERVIKFKSTYHLQLVQQSNILNLGHIGLGVDHDIEINSSDGECLEEVLYL